jgi:hypothetical protein
MVVPSSSFSCHFSSRAITRVFFCRHAVILGDGEMQEGQVYEALMTMRTRNISNLTVIVDINKFQSDNLCDEIKLLPNLHQLFTSFGFTPFEINGNDTAAVIDAWHRCKGILAVILAHTTKPAGTRLMTTEVNSAGKCCQPWHTRVPPWPLYRDVLIEQLSADPPPCPAMRDCLASHLAAHLSPNDIVSLPNDLRPKVPTPSSHSSSHPSLPPLLHPPNLTTEFPVRL